MASNPHSKFSPFTLTLERNAKITGLKYIPDLSNSNRSKHDRHRPLMILIHGGSCSAHNFDVAPGPLTASTPAEMFSAPTIAINRPGCLDSTPFEIPDGSTYHKTLGSFLHSQLFPALWREFGKPNNCTALVPLAHSLGSPGIIISSALHAKDPSPVYPLAGLIISGWGSRFSPDSPHAPADSSQKLTWKRLIMLADPKHNCAPPEALSAIEKQDLPLDPGEMHEILNGTWNSYWREYSNEIVIPIMWAVGEHDLFFEASSEHVREYEMMFPKCPRFDGSLVLGGSHALEWNYLALGWYARCFGFAIEACVWFESRGT